MLDFVLQGVKIMKLSEEKQIDMPNDRCVLALPCEKLTDNPLRLEFYSQVHIEELTYSIKESGLLEPILVWMQPEGDYMIVSGHYRVRAIRRLSQDKILCRVLECDRHTAHIAYCTSNIMTRGLSVIEQAYILSGLIKTEGFTMGQAGRIWGHDKSWVCRRIKLLTDLDPKIKDELGQGTLNARLAQELTRLPQGNDQERVLALVRRHNLNKDEAASLIDWWLDTGDVGRKEAEDEGRIPIIRNALQKMGAAKTRADDPGGYASSMIKRCTLILEGLSDFLKERETPFSWWPQSDYRSFCKAADRLEHIIRDECSPGVKGALHAAPLP
jgi:ParB family chromosome partitioning protein